MKCSERAFLVIEDKIAMAISSYRYESRRTDWPLQTRFVELVGPKPRFALRGSPKVNTVRG